MEFIENIKREQYEQFVQSHKKSHFMQSYCFGDIKKEKNFIPHYVGILDNNKLVATSLLLEKKLIGKYCYLYSPRGYVIDFNDEKLLTFFTNKLKEYAKKKNAIFIKIDPDIKRHSLDSDGNIINSNDNNYKLIEFLKKLGYKHQGFNLGFEKEQPRFTFRINIEDFEKFYKNLHPTTRKILNKKNQFNLSIYKGNKNDIKKFYTTMEETAKRENIIQSPIEYYKKFFEIFNKQNQSDLYIVEANIPELKKIFQNKIAELEKEIDDISTKKYKNKDKIDNRKKEISNQINKLKSELIEINNVKSNNIVLSSIITVKYGDKVWTVHGGNNSVLLDLNANYLLYYKIIEDAYKEGFKIVDCFGTCGIANPDKKNPIYGIHSFKKRLGGEFTEFIGEFDLVTNKKMYYIYKKIIPIYRNFQRKILRRNENKNTKLK